MGTISGGTDYIYNDRYQKIAKVKAGNGYSADGQEFLITPWNTALIVANTIATANLTSIGGPADQAVIAPRPISGPYSAKDQLHEQGSWTWH